MLNVHYKPISKQETVISSLCVLAQACFKIKYTECTNIQKIDVTSSLSVHGPASF